MTAMARPCANAMASSLPGMLAMAPIPMKISVKVPMNSATQGGRSFMDGYVTAELGAWQNSATEKTDGSEKLAPGVGMHFQIKTAGGLADLHGTVLVIWGGLGFEYPPWGCHGGRFSWG